MDAREREFQDFQDFKAMRALKNKPIPVSRPTPSQPDDPDYQMVQRDFPKMKYCADPNHPRAVKIEPQRNPNYNEKMGEGPRNHYFLPSPTFGCIVVKDAEEEAELGPEWVNTPDQLEALPKAKRSKENAA